MVSVCWRRLCSSLWRGRDWRIFLASVRKAESSNSALLTTTPAGPRRRAQGRLPKHLVGVSRVTAIGDKEHALVRIVECHGEATEDFTAEHARSVCGCSAARHFDISYEIRAQAESP